MATDFSPFRVGTVVGVLTDYSPDVAKNLYMISSMQIEENAEIKVVRGRSAPTTPHLFEVRVALEEALGLRNPNVAWQITLGPDPRSDLPVEIAGTKYFVYGTHVYHAEALVHIEILLVRAV